MTMLCWVRGFFVSPGRSGIRALAWLPRVKGVTLTRLPDSKAWRLRIRCSVRVASRKATLFVGEGGTRAGRLGLAALAWWLALRRYGLRGADADAYEIATHAYDFDLNVVADS
jgi:hypothetical protein